jgi:hypothetical protein
MEDKQKVTLYLPPQLHRQLKIRSAVDADSMSNIVEKAVDFYLKHPEAIDGVELHGTTYQIYNCPECDRSVVIKDGEMVALGQQPGLLEAVGVRVGDSLPSGTASALAEATPLTQPQQDLAISVG